ncbi:MAG: uracil-DNA glycosylase family protein [Sulfurifustis sp.]
MRSSETVRKAYLQAMGVTLWRPRAQSATAKPDDFSPQPALSAEQSVATPLTTISAPAAMDWEALQSAVSTCKRCELHATRTQTVFGVGNRSAQWLFVGEAPGADEDRQGEPFVGRAGQLLNAMLEAIGLRREEVYIANVLKCRPPGNRDPQPKEVECCEPFLVRQIELIRPRLIVALGRHAAHSLLKTEVPLSRLRGQRHSYRGTPLIVTFHPAYLLRTPGDKRRAWEDLCLARTIIESAA